VINDRGERAKIQQEWAVIIAQTKLTRGGILPGGVYVNETPPENFYNLPLVLAYATLDHVLGQFLDQGLFPCTSPQKARKQQTCRNLGDKLESAKTAISWVNFAVVKEGQVARNGLAHKNVMATKADCLKYIAAVGAELTGWGVL
jgi:hypothetical protein